MRAAVRAAPGRPAFYAIGRGVAGDLVALLHPPYTAGALHVGLPGLLIAAGCLALSVAQRRLSTPARELRRRTRSVRGVRTRTDGATEELSLAGLLAPLDGALAALSLGVVVLACA